MASYMGMWALTSTSDPRFNLAGRGEVHTWRIPEEATDLLNAKAGELGVQPPEDLEYWYERDPDPGVPDFSCPSN